MRDKRENVKMNTPKILNVDKAKLIIDWTPQCEWLVFLIDDREPLFACEQLGFTLSIGVGKDICYGFKDTVPDIWNPKEKWIVWNIKGVTGQADVTCLLEQLKESIDKTAMRGEFFYLTSTENKLQ